MNTNHDIATQLKTARENAGLSVSALALMSGISRNNIMRIEQGCNVSISTLQRLADTLNTNFTVTKNK